MYAHISILKPYVLGSAMFCLISSHVCSTVNSWVHKWSEGYNLAQTFPKPPVGPPAPLAKVLFPPLLGPDYVTSIWPKHGRPNWSGHLVLRRDDNDEDDDDDDDEKQTRQWDIEILLMGTTPYHLGWLRYYHLWDIAISPVIETLSS